MKKLIRIFKFYNVSALGWIIFAIIFIDRVITLGLIGIPIALGIIIVFYILSIIINELMKPIKTKGK